MPLSKIQNPATKLQWLEEHKPENSHIEMDVKSNFILLVSAHTQASMDRH